jgi:hypothetical protein
MALTRVRLLRPLAVPLLVAALGACANMTNAYAPKSSFSIAADIADFHDKFGTAASLKDYYAHLPETKEGRNEFIAARLTLYNLEYLQFISQFQLTRAQLDSAFDITTIGVNLATSLVGNAATKSILGAVAAGLGQSRTSLEKNFYNTETTSALISAMNAQRKVALVPIVTGMNNDPSQYPLSSAIVDLEAYQQAGTIQGALQAIQADAGVKDAAAQSKIDQYRHFAFQPDDSSERLRAWLFPGVKRYANGLPLDADGKPITAPKDRLTALHNNLAQQGLGGIEIEAFLDNGGLAAQRAEALKTLAIP